MSQHLISLLVYLIFLNTKSFRETFFSKINFLWNKILQNIQSAKHYFSNIKYLAGCAGPRPSKILNIRQGCADPGPSTSSTFRDTNVNFIFIAKPETNNSQANILISSKQTEFAVKRTKRKFGQCKEW